MIEKETKLINVYRKYIYFISKAYDDMFTFANAHGYNCSETEINIGDKVLNYIVYMKYRYLG